MTDREKLIELLHKEVRCPGTVANCMDCPYQSNDTPCDEFAATADMLIAHGVTVREPGEWATDTEDIEWGNSLKKKHCTSCGKRPHFDKEKREFILSDFCPNCGAKMKEESK